MAREATMRFGVKDTKKNKREQSKGIDIYKIENDKNIKRALNREGKWKGLEGKNQNENKIKEWGHEGKPKGCTVNLVLITPVSVGQFPVVHIESFCVGNNVKIRVKARSALLAFAHFVRFPSLLGGSLLCFRSLILACSIGYTSTWRQIPGTKGADVQA